MKIVLPGGTGQVGKILARAFVADGHEVVVLSRSPRDAPWRVVGWDAESVDEWASEVDGADVVINLAGRSVNCRDHAANRRAIEESRINSTRAVGEAIGRASRPPPRLDAGQHGDHLRPSLSSTSALLESRFRPGKPHKLVFSSFETSW